MIAASRVLTSEGFEPDGMEAGNMVKRTRDVDRGQALGGFARDEQGLARAIEQIVSRSGLRTGADRRPLPAEVDGVASALRGRGFDAESDGREIRALDVVISFEPTLHGIEVSLRRDAKSL